MNTVNRDALIVKYAEYVKLLEDQIAKNVNFLNQGGRPADATDVSQSAKFVIDIADLKAAIKAEPKL